MSTAERFAVTLLAAALTACGSPQRPSEPAQPVASDQAAPSQPAQDDASMQEQVAATNSPPVEAPPPDAEPEPKPRPRAAAPAELGRPDWWFDNVVRTDRVVRVCAEAGGPTVRDARRAAIDAARRRLALEGEVDAIEETVSLATVLPLPAADAGPGSAKYIGYVMMEVPAR